MTDNPVAVLREQLKGVAAHIRACPAYERLLGDADIIEQAAAALEAQASAPGGEVTDAAYRWWLSRRPLAFNEAEHLANPGINTCSDAEKALAKAVAAALAARTGKGE